uniref:Uncharacterized protein n=1 Tax=Schistosoma japonicum TaxID=6182 RepID=Q5BZB3_SCHJA|nr:unknown [Schistosoma japonicum]
MFMANCLVLKHQLVMNNLVIPRVLSVQQPQRSNLAIQERIIMKLFIQYR